MLWWYGDDVGVVEMWWCVVMLWWHGGDAVVVCGDVVW